MFRQFRLSLSSNPRSILNSIQNSKDVNFCRLEPHPLAQGEGAVSQRLPMHLLSESVQYGTAIPNVSLNLVLSRTEYDGRTTFDGNSSEWHGCTSQSLFPAYSAIIFVKSNHEHTPSFE